MQIAYQELIDSINENILKTAYLFYGEEHYLMDYALKSIVDKYVNKNLETLNYQVLEGKNVQFEDIYNACETLPFMSKKKIVVVNDLGVFNRKKKGEGDEFQKKDDELKNYIESLDDYVTIIFIEKEGNVNKGKSIVKSIGNIGHVVEFKKLRGKKLNEWIKSKFKEYGKNISYYSIKYFIEYSFYFSKDSNKTLYDLENEIAKLSNFVGNKVEISQYDIENVMAKSLETNIFSLLDSIGFKNINNAMRIFNEMIASNEHPLLILHMIVRQIRLLKHYMILIDSGYIGKDVQSNLKIGNYEYKKITSQSKNFNKAQLDNFLNQCLRCDKLIKTGSMDSKLAIEMLLTELCQ